MKNYKKGLAIIPIIIVLAILTAGGGTYYYLQKTKIPVAANKTANSKIYTNDAYSFSLQYSADWTMSEGDKDDDSLIVTFTSNSNNTVKITFRGFRGATSIRDKLACPIDAFHLSECKELTNTNGVRVVREVHQGISVAQAYLEQNLIGYFESHGYLIKVTALTKDNTGKEIFGVVEMFDSIMNSLSVAPEIVSWKTYQDKKYGYEFKYPDTLKLVQGTTNGSNGVTLNKTGVVDYETPFPSFEVVIDPSGAFGGVGSEMKIDGYLFSKTINKIDAKDLPDYVTICNKSGYNGFTIQRNLVLSKGFYSLSVRGMVCQDDESLLPTFEKILSTFHYTAKAEIPNEKMYKNDTLGFSLAIPQDWIADENAEFQSDTVVFYPNSLKAKYIGTVSVTQNSTGETIDSLRKELTTLNEDVLVSGQKAIRGIMDFEGAGSYYVLKLIYRDKVYTLDRKIAYYPEIFSTFKFTK